MIAVRDAKALIVTLLVLTLFTNVTKALFGGQANAVVDLLFLTAVMLLLHLNTIRYSKLVVLFIAYVVGHAIAQYLNYGGLLSGNHYTDYRNFVRGGAIVLVLLNTNFKSIHQIHSFFAWIFVVIATLAFLDIYSESFAYHVLGVDLRSLPYVEAAYREPGVESPYGNPESRGRIPTLLGAPHHLALTQASLVFVFWYLYKQSYCSRAWFYLALGAVLLVQSRLQIFVVFAALCLYNLRGLRLTCRSVLALVASAIALVFVIRRFGTSFVLASEPEFRLAYEVFTNYGSLDAFRELILLPAAGEMHRVIFGVGGVTGSEQYNNVVSLAHIEIGLIAEMIPKYGLVFVVLYYAILWRSFVALRRSGNDLLALALIPFMAAPLHMWLVNITFVSDMFFVILAYCLLVARADEKKLVAAPSQVLDPRAAFAR